MSYASDIRKRFRAGETLRPATIVEELGCTKPRFFQVMRDMKREGDEFKVDPVPGHPQELQYTLILPTPTAMTVEARLAHLEREVASIRRILKHHNLGGWFGME
jgi:hypothetical protein